MRKIVLHIYLLLFYVSSNAEGTLQIQPDSTVPSNFLLNNEYPFFGQDNALPSQHIKIRIATIGEKIYFGMNNRNESGNFVPDVHYKILDPTGEIVYSSAIPSTGNPGNIATYKQAAAGPIQLGSSDGYNALFITANTTGDYVITFDSADIATIAETRLNLQYFDISVADLTNHTVTGRLHCPVWQISTTSFTTPFLGTVYPYDGGSAVYKVKFNGIRPYVFLINFNSTGTGTGDPSNFLLERQSKIENYINPYFDVFLNTPDPASFPVKPLKGKLVVQIKKVSCDLTNICFSADSAGFLEGYFDFNNNGVYDQNGNENYFGHYFNHAGTYCIPFNGKYANGNLIKSAQFKVLSKVGYGLMSMPLYDVEVNNNGISVEKIDPEDTGTTLFWDDSSIPSSLNIGPKINLDGCKGSTGCHTWNWNGQDCSAFTNCNPPSDYGNQNTINTWWYSTLDFDTLEYITGGTAPVSLSFDPILESHKDTNVCTGDTISFYIFNDGKNHFNSENFTYEWKINNTDATPDVRMQKQIITSATQALITATSKSDPTCFYSDTLRVKVGCPVMGLEDIQSTYSPEKVKVFPNPFASQVFISSEKVLGLVSIYNALGNLIYQSTSDAGQLIIDLTMYKSGIYLLKVGSKTMNLLKE